MGNLSRNNHYIPKFYLKNWGVENKIWEMQLLVPNENLPVWRRESIKKTAFQKNLYIRTTGQSETDDFELWFNTDFESPVQDAFFKAVNDERLYPEDWEKLIHFLAAMSMRTPAQIVKMNNRLKQIVPEVLDKYVSELSKKEDHEIIKAVIEFTKNKKEDNSLFPSIFNLVKNPDENESDLMEIGVPVGKGLNLYAMNLILTNTAGILQEHHWSIVTIADGMTWATSDDPVMCLNRYGKDDYDFNGGWGAVGSEIIFPISPTKAIYTQIGYKNLRRINLDTDMSNNIQRMIIKHAHRSIYSLLPDLEIEKIKPRMVDLKEYEEEEKTWEQFHQHHIDIEKKYYRDHE